MARPNIDRFSWEKQPDESEEDRTNYLLEELNDFEKASKLQPITAEVTAFFNTKWSGALDYTFAKLSKDKKAGKSLVATCDNNDKRKLFSDLVLSSFPLFWQPLYIGVALNLNSRLATHKRLLRRSPGTEDEDYESESGSEEDLKAAKSLGERLSACAFDDEHLWIYTLSVSDQSSEIVDAEIRQIAEAAESWLNILNTPKLGRA